MIPFIILAIDNDNDREFMIAIYIELYPLMKSTAFSIVKNQTTAEDLVHDSIANLIDKIDTIRDFERKRLVSYVVTTVTNNAKNYYNKYIGAGKASFLGLENDMAETIPDLSSTPEEIFDIKEDYMELGMAMKLLPEKEREILYLKYNLEKTDQEICEIMHIKKDSVRQYLTRARRNARKIITKEGAFK